MEFDIMSVMFYNKFLFFMNIVTYFFVQGYLYILARIITNNEIDCYFLMSFYLKINEIKSVNLIKLNIRLRLHHFNKLVGGNIIDNIMYLCIVLCFIVFCFIDKYLYLIFNVF